jgi:hypothetical protein
VGLNGAGSHRFSSFPHAVASATVSFMSAPIPAPIAMPASAPAPDDGVPIGVVDWVGYKWMMASEGERVDVARVQHDDAYAHECLRRGLCARDLSLRETARLLLQRLAAPLVAARQRN